MNKVAALLEAEKYCDARKITGPTRKLVVDAYVAARLSSLEHVQSLTLEVEQLKQDLFEINRSLNS